MYSKVTHAIEVTVEPTYLKDQSSHKAGHYVWAYTVRICNLGTSTVKLNYRYWKIIDANGKLEQVEGEGVVGIQPTIKAGESFEYSSGSHLTTPSGMMMGNYDFCYLTVDGDENSTFSVEIPAFSLDTPNNKAILN